jgi:hypothetical protein
VLSVFCSSGKNTAESMYMPEQCYCCVLQMLAKTGLFLGVFVTREHVRHNKSGIAHRGRTRINHLRELPTKLNHFCSGGQVTLPNRTREPQVCLWSAGCREVGGAASST